MDRVALRAFESYVMSAHERRQQSLELVFDERIPHWRAVALRPEIFCVRVTSQLKGNQLVELVGRAWRLLHLVIAQYLPLRRFADHRRRPGAAA